MKTKNKSIIFFLIYLVPVMCSAGIHAQPVKEFPTGDYQLILTQTNEGYHIEIVYKNEPSFYQNYPAQITVQEKEYRSAYDSISTDKNGFRGIAVIRTEHGSVFTLEDRYKLLADGGFILYRYVMVNKSHPKEKGFASTLSFRVTHNLQEKNDAYDYFIPAILYKNTSDMRPGSVASDLTVNRIYVKETRTGLPLAMLRQKKNGHTLTLMHYKPTIEIGDNPGGGINGEINDALQYGSLGYTTTPEMSVDFHYPCAEGPITYESRQTGPYWTKRFHTIQENNSHCYSVAILLAKTKDYNEAMMQAYSKAYKLEQPAIVPMNMDEIYEQNIELFKAEYRTYGTGAIKAAGLPWSLDLPDGTNTEGVSFQMGFVGQQIAVGYHLYRYGLDRDEPETRDKGISIVDFWVNNIIMKSYFPTVWWDPADNETAGQRRDYPSFLRCFVDGMEGLLDAYRISVAYGEPKENWNEALKYVAGNLVKKQNSDGSFYRAYKTNGDVETGGDRNTIGTSKLNTPVAVRFLVKMYEHTGEEVYKDAALKAAGFAYNELYLKKGKYVGGTPDNPNTVDKEAAIFALYCFNAVHELTGDSKYLEAAEHAALCAMSWTYCYDFAIPNQHEKDVLINPFREGGVQGFSLIATGHSGADNFIAYMFYEMFKLYIKTGKDLYLDMAKLLQNNTKSNTGFDGRMGYKYHAFMPEATNVADLSFRSVSLWLPWASIANIEPMVYLEEAFGEKDLFKLTPDIGELRKKLLMYGCGGKPLAR